MLRFCLCVLGAAILTLIAALHLYWALGGDFGQTVSTPALGGRSVIHVPSYSNALVALGLLAGALVLAARSGGFGSAARTPVTSIAAGVMAVGFALRAIGDFRFLGFFKTVQGTSFAHYDTWVYSPLCVCLAIISAVGSLG